MLKAKEIFALDKCLVCHETVEQPRFGNCCGCMVCSDCAVSLKRQRNPCCPVCRCQDVKFIRCAGIECLLEKLQLNFLSEESLCPQHGDHFYFYCRQCQREVCAHDGRFDPLHDDHNLVPLSVEAEANRKLVEEALESVRRRLSWVRDRMEAVSKVRSEQSVLAQASSELLHVYLEHKQTYLDNLIVGFTKSFDAGLKELEAQESISETSIASVKNSLLAASPVEIIKQTTSWIEDLSEKRDQIPREFRLLPTPIPLDLIPPICRVTQVISLSSVGSINFCHSAIFQILGQGMRLRWKSKSGWLGLWLEVVAGSNVEFTMRIRLLSHESTILASRQGSFFTLEQHCFGWEHYCQLTSIDSLAEVNLTLDIRAVDLNNEAKALRRLIGLSVVDGGGIAYIGKAELSGEDDDELSFIEPAVCTQFASLFDTSIEHELSLAPLQ